MEGAHYSKLERRELEGSGLSWMKTVTRSLYRGSLSVSLRLNMADDGATPGKKTLFPDPVV